MLTRSNDLDFHGRRREGGNLLLHPVRDAGIHGGAAGHDNITVEILSDIEIAFHDGIIGRFVDTDSFLTKKRRLEECLRSPESAKLPWLSRKLPKE